MKIYWVLLSLMMLVACATNRPINEGRQLLESGQVEAGLDLLQEALARSPEDKELRVYYFRQRDVVVARRLEAADQARRDGFPDMAEAGYRQALRYDPASQRAHAGLRELAAQGRRDALVKEASQHADRGNLAAAEARLRVVLAEEPGHPAARDLMRVIEEKNARSQDASLGRLGPAFSKAVTLEFREAPLRSVFEVLARSEGLNFVFDREVRTDGRVTVFLRNSTVEDALNLILMTNQLERKPLNQNTLLIYPSTPQKLRDYQDLVTRSFYLANADAKQVQTLVRQVVKSKDVFIDEKLNVLIVKDSPDAVRLTERLVESIDIADPEVLLEVEVLEVQRSKLLQLGLQFPSEVGYGLLRSDTQSATIVNGTTQIVTTPGGTLASGYVDLENRKGLTTYVANPALLLHLKDQDGDANTLANPRIRVKNREKAKIHIGEKLPVFTTTATVNIGVSSSVNYLDVGLKLDVEPVVHLDHDVEMKVNLEVSATTGQVQGPNGSIAYQIGTRSVGTALRLHDGETQVLAGLINDEERKSATRFPGLGELPLIGKLFSAERNQDSRSEIVLLITPRILRTLARPQLSAVALASGTEKSVGAQPLTIQPTPSGAVRIEAPREALPERAAPAMRPAAMPAPPPPPMIPAAQPAQVQGMAQPAQVQGMAQPTLSLSAPGEVAAGGSMTLTATVRLRGEGITSGEIEVSFDPAMFEAAGGQGNRIRLPLSVSGDSGSATISLRAKPEARGSTLISVNSATVRAGESERSAPIPAPVSVSITPAP